MYCQVGRAYKIFSTASWFPSRILDALRRLRPYLLEFVGVMLFDMWHLLVLQRCRLDVQRLSIYAICAAIMASLVFHPTVASVAEFCVSRVAESNSESHGH